MVTKSCMAWLWPSGSAQRRQQRSVQHTLCNQQSYREQTEPVIVRHSRCCEVPPSVHNTGTVARPTSELLKSGRAMGKATRRPASAPRDISEVSCSSGRPATAQKAAATPGLPGRSEVATAVYRRRRYRQGSRFHTC